MALIIGDVFKSVFERFHITENNINETVTKPDFIEHLNNNVTLYLKHFKNENKKRRFLIVATQMDANNENFGYSYWIPEEYNTYKINLVDILEIFVNQFGLKIKIGTVEGFFIKYAKKLIYKKIENPFDLIEVLAPEQIPCELFFSYNENQIGTINHVDLYYSFAINTSKYIFWLNSFRMVQLEIKAGWYGLVKEMVDYVEPHGKTKIKVSKQKDKDSLSLDTSKEKVLIDIPAIYENQFKYIIKSINELRDKEKILFNISFNPPQCLFCNSTNLSKEHIFPIWLREYTDNILLDNTQYISSIDEQFKFSQDDALSCGHRENLHGFTSNLVCVDCNNTWMSKLENQIKNLIIKDNKIIDALPDNVSEQDAKLLSIWVISKSLLISNKMFSNIHEIKDIIFKNLKQSIISEGFLVEITSAEKLKTNIFIGKGFFYDKLFKLKNISLETAKELTSNFFICCIQINHLLFRISYLDTDIKLKRETSMRRTFKLHPFKKDIKHNYIEIEDVLWQKAKENNLEMNVFSFGLMLSD